MAEKQSIIRVVTGKRNTARLLKISTLHCSCDLRCIVKLCILMTSRMDPRARHVFCS